MVSLIMILLLSVISSLAPGADVMQEISELRNGTLVFSYPSREGVEGNDDCLRVKRLNDHTSVSFTKGYYGRNEEYWSGDLVAECRIRKGKVTELDLSVLPESGKRPRADVDLGSISADQAVSLLLGLVGSSDDEIDSDAILGAALARDGKVARPFIKMARDRKLSSDTRQESLFWLAILAGDKAIDPIRDIIDDDDEEMDLRCDAVFALSQLQEETAFPLLLDLARNNPNPEVQRSAFFWLADYDRPEVVDFFEEILLSN